MGKTIYQSAKDLQDHLAGLNPNEKFEVTVESHLLMVRADGKIICPSVYDGLAVLIGPTDGLKVN